MNTTCSRCGRDVTTLAQDMYETLALTERQVEFALRFCAEQDERLPPQ